MGKVLITGGSGLLGSNLAEIFCKDFEVFIIFNKNPVKIDYCNEMKIDLIDFENVEKIIKKINPLIIIHCAALTNVDYCEKNPKEAKEINCDSTKNLARIGKEIGAKFIYISTDSIFDGETGGYSENDIPNPINVYAKTKLEGEEEVRKINGNYIIIRTNIYGKNKIQKFSLA
ncbi:MAG: SDR family oxidoreductase, partial [Nanoarchaeota archaeon]